MYTSILLLVISKESNKDFRIPSVPEIGESGGIMLYVDEAAWIKRSIESFNSVTDNITNCKAVNTYSKI